MRMSAQTLNPEELASAARAALEKTVDTKVDAVRAVVERSVQAEDAERLALDAKSAFENAWAAAITTGWTDKELRQLGLTAPGQSRPRTTRKRRSGDAPAVDGE